jgi:hypothetical protein
MSSSAKSTYDVNNVINLEGKRALIIGAGRGIGRR